MSISSISDSSPVGLVLYTDSALGNSLSRVKTSSAVLFYITANNVANPTTPVFLKLFDALAANVVLGTTAPFFVWKIPGGSVSNLVLTTGVSAGFTFLTALTAACVLTGGSEGSANPPQNPVSVLFSYV
jgi:hypothetical protein